MVSNIRFVITHVPRAGQYKGMRTLIEARQGQYTYATTEEAQAKLELFSGPEGFVKVIGTEGVKTLQVRPVECWEDHNDPKTCWFK